MARTMAEGLKKYGKDNWKKGMPIDECLNHALRHQYLWLEGDRAEDHLAHAACNLMMAIHFLEQAHDS